MFTVSWKYKKTKCIVGVDVLLCPKKKDKINVLMLEYEVFITVL